MRPLVLSLILASLGCSGRDPPIVGRFDAAAWLPEGGASAGDVSPLFADAPRDVTMIPEGSEVPEWSLPDLNPASRTSGMTISPATLRPKIVAYYFSNAI